MKFICPLVVVEDVQKSRFLYEHILGQTVKMDFGENITFHGDFAIHQKNHFKTLINNSPISIKSNNFELYFEDDDLETIVNKLKDNGFEFLHEIVEQPWKQKVVRFYDYGGCPTITKQPTDNISCTDIKSSSSSQHPFTL